MMAIFLVALVLFGPKTLQNHAGLWGKPRLHCTARETEGNAVCPMLACADRGRLSPFQAEPTHDGLAALTFHSSGR